MPRKICWIFEAPKPAYHKNNPLMTYYDGFTFKGDNYTLGWVKLNEDGMKFLNAGFPWIKIKEHYIDASNGKPRTMYRLQYFVKYDSWHRCYLSSRFDPDKHLECIEGVEDVESDMYFSGLPLEEYLEIIELRNAKNGIEPSMQPVPHAKDWEIPELMIGWVFFLIIFAGSFVFKDWYIRFAIQVFIGIWFALWRLKKIYWIE